LCPNRQFGADKEDLKKYPRIFWFSLAFLPNCVHNVYVIIVGKEKLQNFWKKHNRAKKPIEKWIQTVEAANWSKFNDVQQTFSSACWVPVSDRRFVVFNIKGKQYRIVTAINFKGQIVVIWVAVTHSEYDKDKWKSKL